MFEIVQTVISVITYQDIVLISRSKLPRKAFKPISISYWMCKLQLSYFCKTTKYLKTLKLLRKVSFIDSISKYNEIFTDICSDLFVGLSLGGHGQRLVQSTGQPRMGRFGPSSGDGIRRAGPLGWPYGQLSRPGHCLPILRRKNSQNVHKCLIQFSRRP